MLLWSLNNSVSIFLFWKGQTFGKCSMVLANRYIKFSGPLKMTEAIWLGFSLRKARLKNPNDNRRRSRSLVFGICEASIHKLAKSQGCFKGSRQYILSWEKNTPRQIPNKTVWPRKLLFMNIHEQKAIYSSLPKGS